VSRREIEGILSGRVKSTLSNDAKTLLKSIVDKADREGVDPKDVVIQGERILNS
jgi:hypothetical protein